jgi:hypothetical protein
MYIAYGEKVHEEQLVMYQILLERLAKYLLRPALEVDLNIKGKIVAMGNEITVTIETPSSVIEAGQEWARRAPNSKSPRRASPSSDSKRPTAREALTLQEEWSSSSSSSPRMGKNLLAMSVHAQIYLADLIDDSRALEASLKSRHDRSG